MQPNGRFAWYTEAFTIRRLKSDLVERLVVNTFYQKYFSLLDFLYLFLLFFAPDFFFSD